MSSNIGETKMKECEYLDCCGKEWCDNMPYCFPQDYKLETNNLMDLLRDGEWHGIKEMQEKLGRSKQICQVANFLVSYNFCDRKPADGVITKIRLRYNVLKFLEALDKIEEKCGC